MSLIRMKATISACAGLLALPVAAGCDGSRSVSRSAPPPVPAVAPAPVTTSDADVARKAWGRAMAKTRTPKAGCFKATHPSTTWEEIACVKPSSVPLRPATGAPTSRLQVGNGGSDESSTIAVGTLGFAEGSFPQVQGVTYETGLLGGDIFPDYSLQLNTNTSSSAPACVAGPNPSGCTGWQQFAVNQGQLVVQRWLINYWATDPGPNPQCPDDLGYTNNGYYQNGAIVPQYDCWSDGTSAVNLSAEFTSADLFGVALSGQAGIAQLGTSDQATLYFQDTVVALTTPDGSPFNLYQWWSTAEFNVFGPGGGSGAVFNYGATIGVQTITVPSSGLAAPPSCDATTFTAETNNLSVVANSCCAVGGENPGIFFTESNAPGATAFPCPTILSRQ